jgi:hypothetical protein
MQPQAHMRALRLIPALLLMSCAAPAQSFRPTAESGASREGEPAAAYEVRDDGSRVAQVNVWSQGAFVADDGATYVHVALEVQNVGTGAISLDAEATALEAFDAAGVPLAPPRLASILPAGAAQRAVAPSAAQDVDLVFALGTGIAPEGVGSLRLRWTIIHSDARRYVQFTDFTRDESRPVGPTYAYVPIYGFYDPFFAWTLPRVHLFGPHHVHVRRVVVAPSRRWHWHR